MDFPAEPILNSFYHKVSDLHKLPALIIATGLGSGYSPFAPGTAGSLVALPFIWLLYGYSGWVYALVAALVFVTGTWAAGVAEEVFNEKDSGKITIDEIAGMLVAMFLIPPTPGMMLGGFILFRLFDITKPFPAGVADRRLGGGLGVMLDDVVAGVYANLCLQGIRAVIS